MDPSSGDLVREIPGFIRVYRDGRVEKLTGTDVAPAGIDPSSGVDSKDIIISPETNLSARLYIPNTNTPGQKIPLLIYYHGGGFIIESSSSPLYHSFLNLVVAESNIVVVSVDYRRAPEHPLPIGYDDSWEAIKWVGGHASGSGPEPWLNNLADLQNVFVAGDSAGGNIAHHMAIRVGYENIGSSIKLQGIILLHPFFWGAEPIANESDTNPGKKLADEIWTFACPTSGGLDNPWINPATDPKVSKMGCSKVLVCVAGNDILKDRGWYYKQVMENSGWEGEVVVVEDEGEKHVFFLFNPSAKNACTLRTRICTFINSGGAKP